MLHIGRIVHTYILKSLDVYHDNFLLKSRIYRQNKPYYSNNPSVKHKLKRNEYCRSNTQIHCDKYI